MTQKNFTIDNGLTVTGSGGNITGATNIEVSANVTAGNLVTLGTAGDIVMTGGNISNVGNVSVTGNIVAHVFSGADEYSNPIRLAPSLADYANLKYMQIRAGDDDSHIHFDTGNNAQYNIYVGDDNKFVRVANNGNITITVHNSNVGALSWDFLTTANGIAGNSGIFNVPQDSYITTANASGGLGGYDITIQAGASDPDTYNPYPGGDLILKGGYGSFGDGGGGSGGNVYIYGGASSDTAPGNITIDSGGYTWTFDNSGNLTLSDGNIIAPAIVQNGAYNTSVALSSSTGIIETNTGGNATQFLPGGTVRLSAAGSGQIISGIFDGSGITLGGSQTDVFQTRGGNVTVKIGTGGTTANTWTFAQGGSLLAPGAISAVGNITAANFIGNILITGNVQGTSANVTLVAGSYSTVFDNIGTATFPGAVQLAVYANTTVRDAAIASPQPGMMIYVTGTGMQVRGASSWNTIAGSGT